MGGTFDRLHVAHQLLLRTAAHMAEEVFVGVVSDELGKELFAEKDFADQIHGYDQRSTAVIDFLQQYAEQYEVAPLLDPWGPAPADTRADLIVVSFETEKNAHRINEMRQENNLPALDIITIPWVYVDGELISSSRLRAEENSEQ